jgi:hypothetical protein
MAIFFCGFPLRGVWCTDPLQRHEFELGIGVDVDSRRRNARVAQERRLDVERLLRGVAYTACLSSAASAF